MIYFILKCLLSGLVVGVVSEISRRSTTMAAMIASLPLTSILAFIWIYHETKDVPAIGKLSIEIALIVVPSILFFILFWYLVRSGWSFYPSLASSVAGLIVSYAAYTWMLSKMGLSST